MLVPRGRLPPARSGDSARLTLDVCVSRLAFFRHREMEDTVQEQKENRVPPQGKAEAPGDGPVSESGR